MNGIKKLFNIFIVITLLVGGSGCMNKKENKPKLMKNKALEYLNSRYDDRFIPLGFMDNNWAYDYSVIMFNSEKYNESFEVKIYNNENSLTFEDNYFKLFMRDDATEFFHNIVLNYYKNCITKVDFISPNISYDLEEINSFSDYINSNKANMEVYIIVDNDFNDLKNNKILNVIADKKIQGYFNFMEVENISSFSNDSISDIVNKMIGKKIPITHFSINKDYQIVKE